VLSEKVLQREGEITQARGFRPGAIGLVVFDERDVREEAASAMRAFFETGLKLI